jgi:hypothetical protein
VLRKRLHEPGHRSEEAQLLLSRVQTRNRWSEPCLRQQPRQLA